MKRFILFNSLNDDIIISEVLSYLEEDNYDKHQYILNRLLEKALDLPIDGDLFKMYLCYLVRQDENLFTIKSENVGNEIDKNLFNIALNDIRVIKRLFDISEEFCTLNDNKISDNDPIFNIFKYNEDINTIGNLLVDFYYKNGAGIMNYYKGFKWDKNKGLIGIENCDPITFDELIGNEMQLKILINNTESFINGELCNNVLLFGDSGTGKSSSVKAILNKYYNKKLRVIELNKDSTFKTYDLRFKDLVGKKVKEPLKYLFYQIMPTNTFDAVHRAIKFFIGLGITALIVIILILLFG